MIDQSIVKLEQRRVLNESARFRDAARIQEQCGSPEHNTIKGGQIRSALSGSITDQKLIFEKQRLCGDGGCATRAREFRDGDEKAAREEAQFAHEMSGTTPANARKTARSMWIGSYSEFAADSFALRVLRDSGRSLLG